MHTKVIHWLSRRQLQERGEFYKERMPGPGVRRLLGHTIHRTVHGSWKYSARWEIKNHPGYQYNVFTNKSQCASLLWHEYNRLIRAVNDIEDEKYEKQKRP